jgi:hypothetical protein
MTSISVSRYEAYKNRMDSAAATIIRTVLHIIRPIDGFRFYSTDEIKKAWDAWYEEEQMFYNMTQGTPAPLRSFPEPPPSDVEYWPCRRMWSLLIQQQVEGEFNQAPSIKAVVEEILESEMCANHPASCSCKLLKNPWTSTECLDALKPLNALKEDPIREQYLEDEMKQHYREMDLIRKKRIEGRICSCSELACACFNQDAYLRSVHTPITINPSNRYQYNHDVKTCPCGTCYKARVDSGMHGSYTMLNGLKHSDQSAFNETSPV